MSGKRAERLRAGAERGRVRRGAGENAEHRRRVEAREPADERRAHRAENHDRRREHVQSSRPAGAAPRRSRGRVAGRS